MARRWGAAVVCAITSLLWLFAAESRAQEQPAPATGDPGRSNQAPAKAATMQSDLPDCDSASNELKTGVWHLEGDVECDLQDGVRVSADEVDVYTEDGKNRIVARGSVSFAAPEAHVSADRLTYDTSTGLGTFEIAFGYLSLGDNVRPEMFGSREALVYFEGERLEKLAPRRYRVTNGRWTTCEQPTPRWQFASGGMMINLEDYVVARNTVLRVKNVPLFYTPYIYYPIKKEDRATGFLMPTYGVSTYRGPSISNAFFWALDRSQDVTFFHDWFTRAGQGTGAEYRYAASPQSSGGFRGYTFWREQSESTENGATTVLPATTSFEISGAAIQSLWQGATARVRLDYFSDVQTQQLLHQSVYEASRRNRVIEGGLTAGFGNLSTNVLYQRNEFINSVTDTIVSGSTPRANATLAPIRLFQTPMYASITADYAFLPQRRTLDGEVIQDDSFGRFDVAPSVRVPLSRLSYLSVNTSAGYRSTYYTRQAGLITPTQPGAYFRQYVSSRTDIVGPTVSRVFDRPEHDFANRMKHVIEPTFAVDFTSAIDDFRKTPISGDLTDFIVSNSTRLTYGVTNRLFSRNRTADGSRDGARELLTVGVQQTYYTKPESSRYDGNYASGQGSGVQKDLSPVAISMRVTPGAALDANARIEYDVSTGAGLQLFTTGASFTRDRSAITLNYSRQRFGETQPWSSFLTTGVHTTTRDDRVTASYSLSFDVTRAYMVSQDIVVSYMAQCCGVKGEYQRFNYPPGSGLPVASDRRLNIAFVLAGVGTFSNFFGAFGGQ